MLVKDHQLNASNLGIMGQSELCLDASPAVAQRIAQAAVMKRWKFSAYKYLRKQNKFPGGVKLHVLAAEGLGHLRRLPKSLKKQFHNDGTLLILEAGENSHSRNWLGGGGARLYPSYTKDMRERVVKTKRK